jgi:hypothetical protein
VNEAYGVGNTDADKVSAISFISAGQNKPVCVVEAEKTAVIMSEHYPQQLWLAAGGLNELTPQKLFPLRGRRIILFPDTDPDGKAFRLWYDIALKAQWLMGQNIFVSPLLEQHATPEQKQRKIDLVDFLFPNVNPNCNGYGL